MAGSVSMRNRRNTPPLIQQFGNDIVGFVDGIVAIPVSYTHLDVYKRQGFSVSGLQCQLLRRLSKHYD